jgi:benzil reductase ((S)-benzoin forming)
LDHFLRTLALEQASEEHPIDVVLIDPGIMDTEMQAKIRSTEASLFPDLQRFKKFEEEGLLEKPETVARKIYDILSGDVENGKRYSLES